MTQRSKRMKNRTWPGALLLALLLLLTACAGTDNTTKPQEAAGGEGKAGQGNAAVEGNGELAPVELVWYYPQPAAQSDLATMEKALNERTQAAINATVKLKPIDFGEYTQKMNTIAASGEKFDIAWTSNWNFDFVQNVHKGVFIPLDELLGEYAPELAAELPDFMWDMVKVGGDIYGVPNYQSITGREGFIIPTAYAEKYGLQPESIRSWPEIEPFLEAIKTAEPDVWPLAVSRSGMFSYLINSQNIDTLPITNNPPIGFYRDAEALELINVYASPEYREYTEIMREWYGKKYINHDAPTLKSTDDLTNAGKGIVSFSHGLNPGTEVGNKNNKFGGKDVLYVPLTEFIISSNPGIATVNAISKTSANPERAMMLLNLVNTDPELFNLLSYGVEGVHYDKLDERTIRINETAGYAPKSAWVFGNTFNGYLTEGQAPDTFEVQKATNESATPTRIVGFKFDSQSVTSEIANLQTVLDEYLPGLNTGAIDPATKLPEFLDRMEKAGIGKVMEEAQRQLNEWQVSK